MAISGATLVPKLPERGHSSVWTHEITDECIEADHLGVVFVHGVGFQTRGETLLAWSDRLIRMLAAHHGTQATVPDLVKRAEIDLDGAGLSGIELRVPGKHPRRAQHWLLTEAFWAASIQPPSVATMLSWFGARGAASLAAANFGAPKRLRNSVYLSGVVIGLLVVYAAIRVVTSVIPITAVRNSLIAPLDRLLTGWSGDMHVLLNDPAQSANIRTRVYQATRALAGAGFDRVAMVAHSGGAVAGYMTLTDASLWQASANGPQNGRAVPSMVSLVTLGQGLNIAWRLCDLGDDGGECNRAEGSCRRLVLPLTRLHPRLRWHDFWSDGDTVADAALAPPDCLVGTVDDEHSIENKPSEAHGAYWDNDEEFLLPVVDRLQGAARTPGAEEPARDFPSPNRDWVAERHLRVGMFSLTRRVLFSALALAILGGASLGGAGVDDIGRGVTSVLSRLPGHEILTVPAGELHRVAAGEWLPARHAVGQFGISLLLVLLTIYSPLRLGPQKLAWEYRPWSPLMRLLIQAVDVAIAFVPILPLAVWFGSAKRGAERFEAPFWPFVVAVVVVAVVLVVLLLRLQSLIRTTRSGLGAVGILFLASVVVSATLLEVAGNHTFGTRGAPLGETAVGAAAAWLLFSLLGRVANWRWDAWDDREREQFRRARGVKPPTTPQIEPPPTLPAEPRFRWWGRRVDLLVIGFVGTAAMMLAAALGAPFVPDGARFWLSLAVGGIVFAIWLIGSGQDAANSRAGVRPAEVAPLPAAAS